MLGMVPKGLASELEEFGNQRKNQDYPNYSIAETDQNTEKSPGDLRRLAITQSLVKYHQLMLAYKNLQEVK